MRTSAGEYAMHVCKIVLLGQVLSGVAVATLMMTRSAAIDGDDKQYYIMALGRDAARLLLPMMMIMILDETFRG